MIAGGAVTGILIAAMIGYTVGYDAKGSPISLLSRLRLNDPELMGVMGDAAGLAAFAALAFVLWRFAKS